MWEKYTETAKCFWVKTLRNTKLKIQKGQKGPTEKLLPSRGNNQQSKEMT